MTRSSRLLLWLATTYLVVMTSGCSPAPTVDIMGALFPAWLLCFSIGVLLASVTHFLLRRYGINILYPLLAYPCLAAVFTFSIWLGLF